MQQAAIAEGMTQRQKLVIMGSAMLGLFLAAMDQTIVNTALPKIVASLGGITLFSWVVTAYILASTSVVPIVGRLSDIFGRKWFIMSGIVLFLIGSMLSGLAQDITQLIAFRALQGLGGGTIMVSAFIIVGDLFPPAERGKWQGVNGMAFGLASVAGPGLGGLLTDYLSWRWVFYINVPIGIVALAVLWAKLPNLRYGDGHGKVDYLGAAVMLLAVVPLLLAFSWGGAQYPWTSAPIVVMFAFSALMVGLLLWVEAHAPEPIIPLHLFRSPIFTSAVILTFLTGVTMLGTLLFIPLFFQAVLQKSATFSGLTLAPMMIGAVAGSLVSGQALSRLGGHYRWQSLLGFVVMSTGIYLLSRMDASTSTATAVRNMVITGVGIGSTIPTLVIAAQNALPHRMLGISTSLVQFVRQLGGTFGVALLGSLLSRQMATGLASRLPDRVRQEVPADLLERLADPQRLLSADSLQGVRQAFNQLGEQGPALFQEAFASVREALATAISDVFLIALAISLSGLIFFVFLREVPLRKTWGGEEAPPMPDHRPPLRFGAGGGIRAPVVDDGLSAKGGLGHPDDTS
ncbi:MAG: MDR family MFS transporter [Dehalococcoidia bacterium]